MSIPATPIKISCPLTCSVLVSSLNFIDISVRHSDCMVVVVVAGQWLPGEWREKNKNKNNYLTAQQGCRRDTGSFQAIHATQTWFCPRRHSCPSPRRSCPFMLPNLEVSKRLIMRLGELASSVLEREQNIFFLGGGSECKVMGLEGRYHGPDLLLSQPCLFSFPFCGHTAR